MAQRIELHLIPTPGAKPEFLANVTTPSSSFMMLTPKVLFEGYTRDSWAWKPHPNWRSIEVIPCDSKSERKLSDFIKYLKERQKCAYGRIGGSSKGMVTVSYIQSSNTSTLRVTPDASQIPNCAIVPVKPTSARQQPKPAGSTVLTSQQPRPNTVNNSTFKKKPGMLGNLLGAQQRTDQHMNTTVNRKRPVVEEGDGKTAQQVLQDFRLAMEQKMLDFDLDDSQNEAKVQLNLASICQELSNEEKLRITMDVLKYIVFEQAEEVNEEWVCYKEPSEFMDDITITVYKEAPEEVLQEVNQVELTEEQRGEQRALQEARLRQLQKEARGADQVAAHVETDDDDDLMTLNVHKRDRRTIEEIQREMNHDTKRPKT